MALLVFAAQIRQLGLGWKTYILKFEGMANDYIYIYNFMIGMSCYSTIRPGVCHKTYVVIFHNYIIYLVAMWISSWSAVL